MSVQVRIPTPLQKCTQQKAVVDAEGDTVGEILTQLTQSYPDMKERLFDESGALRRFINIFVNAEDIRFLQGLDSGLKDGDEVSIVPAIAGGA